MRRSRRNGSVAERVACQAASIATTGRPMSGVQLLVDECDDLSLQFVIVADEALADDTGVRMHSCDVIAQAVVRLRPGACGGSLELHFPAGWFRSG